MSTVRFWFQFSTNGFFPGSLLFFSILFPFFKNKERSRGFSDIIQVLMARPCLLCSDGGVLGHNNAESDTPQPATAAQKRIVQQIN